MIYLTAIGLKRSCSSTYLHTKNTWNNTIKEECGPCPVFARYTLAFALQLRKKHGKNSLRVENRTCIISKLNTSILQNSSQALTYE